MSTQTGPGWAATGIERDVERAVRTAARAGNRLLAGTRAELRIADPGRAAVLARVLQRMGVREPVRAGDRPDFVFADRDGSAIAAALRDAALRDAAHANSGGERLPITVVPVPDGGAEEDAVLLTAVRAELGTGWRTEPLRRDVVEFRGPEGAAALAAETPLPPEEDARARIEWAELGMPVTAALADELSESGRIRGVRVAVSLVLEPKTSALALALQRAGAEVAVFSAVSETDPAVAGALSAGGVRVFAPQRPVAASDAAAIDAEHAAGVLDWHPELLVDDGSHLIRLAHTERPGALAGLRGASEETTSGVRPLHEMVASDELRLPVIAVNDARTKTDFDNRVGTGQSCVLALADVLDAAGARGPLGHPLAPVSGTAWAVIGYGPVGEGVARFAAALGARVTVVERDAVRALAAVHDGFDAASLKAACAAADVVISATGVWHTLDGAALAALRPGTAVAVAGGIDDELGLDELRAAGWRSEQLTPDLAEWRAPARGGAAERGILILADGGGVNYTAGEGNPIEVMDLSFATQLAALDRLAGAALEPGVHVLDTADELRVASAALAARGDDADPAPDAFRPGGAAQPWRVHRYRSAG